MSSTLTTFPASEARDTTGENTYAPEVLREVWQVNILDQLETVDAGDSFVPRVDSVSALSSNLAVNYPQWPSDWLNAMVPGNTGPAVRPEWGGKFRTWLNSVVMSVERPVPEHDVLARAIALEQNSVGFDVTAATILGRIFDRGHATCEDLADWLETPEEWIAFSRLQRARLLYDSGTEFTVSPAGRSLIHHLLNEVGEE